MLATFGAGCFWHVEEVFRKIDGVIATAAGFMGGTVKSPSYSLVCSGKTGHAEVVQIEFDPGRVSYEDLLGVFWKSHDPTQLNRQGPDVGEQYRSVIFYHNASQKKLAEESMTKIREKASKKIATLIVPASEFYRAEEYHQKYVMKHKMK